MSKGKKHIDQLTPELIDKYYKGLLSEDEQHQIERLMLNSSFENEAMEGFDRYEGDLLADLNKINSQLEDRISKEKNDNVFFYIKIAASILLLALSTYLVYDIAKDTNKPQIAQNEPSKITEEYADEESGLEEENADIEAEFSEEIPKEAPAPLEKKETKIEPNANSSNIKTDPLFADNTNQKENEVIEIQEVADLEVDNKDFIAEDFVSEEIVAVESAKEEVARPLEARKKSVARSTKDEAPSAAGLAMTSAPAPSIITGKVTSLEDGQPLPGVNVVLKGTTKGAVTDIDGRFEIGNIEADEKDALVISFIGLATEEVEIGDKSQIDVQMGSDVSQLSEVVVVGYGSSSTEVDNSINTWNNSRPSISMSDYKDYLRENTRYDSSQQKKGKVAVKFDILENGQLTNFEIKRSLDNYYDQEAIRLIKEGPEWLPAEQNGNKVKSTARVTVKFDNE